MGHEFDPGYPSRGGFARLAFDYPGPEAYPLDAFRIEWGPVFHRGRLDGTARVLVIGQDPAAHESIVRRILVGEAGQRVQGFLARLGIERSYVMVNAFAYAVYGQAAAEAHRDDPPIANYRHRWFEAVLGSQPIEVVVTLGRVAAVAYASWAATPAGEGLAVPAVAIIHPTFPESAAASGSTTLRAAMTRMLENWNEGLAAAAAILTSADVERPLEHYDPGVDPPVAPIPERDLPAGLPDWMRAVEPWARRRSLDDAPEVDPLAKRADIAVNIPAAHRPWQDTGL